MYIISTLEFPTHNLKFHLLTTSVNAKYYYSTMYLISEHGDRMSEISCTTQEIISYLQTSTVYYIKIVLLPHK